MQRLQVTSYRRIFRTDWRLTRVWEFDLTKLVPGGIPVKAALWVLGTLFCIWVLSHIPPMSYALNVLPVWIRYGTIGMLVGFLSQQETPDGRSVHAYALARLSLLLRGPKPKDPPWTWWATRLAVTWDTSGAELHRGRVSGPAHVTANVPVTLGHRRNTLVMKGDSSGPPTTEVVVMSGTTVEVRP